MIGGLGTQDICQFLLPGIWDTVLLPGIWDTVLNILFTFRDIGYL